jgi:Cu+-exporting ATPase
MPAVSEIAADIRTRRIKTATLCYHCGLDCTTESIAIDDKAFCCEGCKLVYEILNNNGLCNYYKLQTHPGLSQIKGIRNDKYSYLDNEDIASQLYQFTDGDRSIVTFYIPGVHCSSCMWLLEHLSRLNDGISESRLNFSTKEVTIHFSRKKTTIRKITELLATIGYEPYISLNETNKEKTKSYNKQRILKLGVAGFCFGNIMMMSFPEYLAHKTGIDEQYAHLFRYLNLLLAVPVFFYSASEFFVTAWKGLKQKTLNIDAPIALAIIITFARSVVEIAGNTGGGYLDSMSGIVFFMLVGRIVQERTYKSLSFTRDYKSYFPLAVDVVTAQGTISKKLQDLKEKDVVLLHNDEIIPADALLVKGTACIDYSFVTGESEPIKVKNGEVVYAGGKQKGEQLTIQIVKPVAGSYLTSLWNHYAFSKNKAEKNDKESAVHILSKYFTFILFGLAAVTAVYWYLNDPSKIINSVSAMLIVACPCALLLSATFTNGNIMRILSDNGLYLRDPSVIEQLGNINEIVFDKTGTITTGVSDSFICSGHQLSDWEKDLLYTVVSSSSHPNSKGLLRWLGKRTSVPISAWKETPGRGLDAISGTTRILVGSASFIGLPGEKAKNEKATTYVRINDKVSSFHLRSVFRDNVPQMVNSLRDRYQLSVLSGDHDKQRSVLEDIFGNKSELLFEQKPLDKLRHVETLQATGKHVMMIGDGLNDAGALQQSNVGVTLADDINNFTPSCDAILDAKKLSLLPSILKVARSAKRVIRISFAISIAYNLIGLYFATQGLLKPVAAAILMPCSTLSIVIITSGVSSLVAWRSGLSLSAAE